jgi:branched-chain amino acid transport system substrate-binding protein
MTGDEQLLIQGKSGWIAEHVERLQDLRGEEAAQHLVAANPLKQRDHVRRLARIVSGGLDGGSDKRMVRTRRLEILREERPGILRVAFREGQKSEVPPAQRRLRVGDHGPKPRDSPTRPDERRGSGMLPALELGDAERDNVRIEKRPAPLQQSEQTAVDRGEGAFERLGIRAARERERFPPELSEVQLFPRCFQFGGVTRGDQSLEPRRKTTQPPNCIHTGNVESAWILRYPIHRLNLASLMRWCRALLASALWISACSTASSRGPIVLGLAGPFSQARGVSMRHAAELAVQEINAQGGIRGRRLELRIRDDSARPDMAIRIAREFVADPSIVAVVGHLTSTASLAAGRTYGGREGEGAGEGEGEARHPVVMISPSASSPDLSGVNPYVFRACPSDLSHGAQLARYARKSLSALRVGVIYLDDDYGRGLRHSFASEFRRLGGQIVEEDPMLSTTSSLEPYLSRLRQGSGIDALMLATDRGGAELALREMRALGQHWIALGGDALTGIEKNGALAEGVRMSIAYLVDQPGDRNAKFVAAYARAYPGERPDHRGATAYDIIHLLATVIAEVGTDRRAIRDRLARVGVDQPAFQGVTGKIAFDKNGDVPEKPVVIGTVRDGQLITEPGQ